VHDSSQPEIVYIGMTLAKCHLLCLNLYYAVIGFCAQWVSYV